MNELGMFKPGVILLIVAAAASLVLGAVNLGTEGRIASLAEEKMTSAMQTVLPADSYTDTGYADDGEINAIYAASSGGWVVQVTESGSQGLITLMAGVSPQLTCTGISVTASSETAGLGAIASQASEKGDAFRSQFVGVSGTAAVTKEGGTIDAIAGATITSKAIAKAVTAALDACAQLGQTTEQVSRSQPAARQESAEPAAQQASTEPAAQQASTEPAAAAQASAEPAAAAQASTGPAAAAQASTGPAAAAPAQTSAEPGPASAG